MLHYNSTILDHFQHPRNAGVFPADTLQVRSAVTGARLSGAVIQLQIQVVDNIIQAARFKAYGCVATIAACSWLTELLQGRTLEQAARITPQEIMTALDLPLLKRHRIILIIEALQRIVGEKS